MAELSAAITVEFAWHRFRVKQISSGVGGHTCALFYDSRMTCWGENGDGQLGVNSMVATGTNSPTLLLPIDFGNPSAAVTQVNSIFLYFFFSCNEYLLIFC